MNPNLRRRLTLAFTALGGASAIIQSLRGHQTRAHRQALLATAAFLAPTLVPNCAWNGPVLRRLRTSEREVWLTIDDGPDPHDTPEILEVLAQHGAHASFFVIGCRVWRYPTAARAIITAGHDLQNHTWSHPACAFWAATPSCARHEIDAGSAAIDQVTGSSARFFRAPAGLANTFVHAAAARAGLQIVGWSRRGYDGVPHRPTDVVDRITHHLEPGDIILLHEGPVPGLRAGTRARTLDHLLRELTARGYRTAPCPA
jgi:peptidoglycan/xylan/chitin deacetylase (PgdA/CDA1 family)